MTSTPAEAPRRGRPRSEKAKQAILTAASELLLEHGLHAMSMDDVAERAGVSKATIYRWWGSKELLALDALATAWAAPVPAAQRDTGSLRGDLLETFCGVGGLTDHSAVATFASVAEIDRSRRSRAT